jgi:hypothetical protein
MIFVFLIDFSSKTRISLLSLKKASWKTNPQSHTATKPITSRKCHKRHTSSTQTRRMDSEIGTAHQKIGGMTLEFDELNTVCEKLAGALRLANEKTSAAKWALEKVEADNLRLLQEVQRLTAEKADEETRRQRELGNAGARHRFELDDADTRRRRELFELRTHLLQTAAEAARVALSRVGRTAPGQPRRHDPQSLARQFGGSNQPLVDRYTRAFRHLKEVHTKVFGDIKNMQFPGSSTSFRDRRQALRLMLSALIGRAQKDTFIEAMTRLMNVHSRETAL